jgi:hypothetical protein
MTKLKIGLTIFGLVFILAGCDAPAWKTYSSPDGWSIKYPADWTYREVEVGGGRDTIFVAPEKFKNIMEISIDVSYSPKSYGADSTAENLLAIAEDGYKSIPDVNNATAKIITLPTGQAIRSDYSKKISDQPYSTTIIQLYKGGFQQKEMEAPGLTLIFSAPTEYFQKYSTILDKMAQNLAINQ